MSEQQKNQMEKKRFRIGELSKALQVKKFVIRFWEKEFGLKSDRSQGGQRYYTHNDYKAFNTIKYLLYKQGFTIAGAKSQLKKFIKSAPHEVNEEKQITAATKIVENKEFLEKIKILKKQLCKLRESL
jgi:DNA-binding transcriptional MerR regulator